MSRFEKMGQRQICRAGASGFLWLPFRVLPSHGGSWTGAGRLKRTQSVFCCTAAQPSLQKSPVTCHRLEKYSGGGVEGLRRFEAWWLWPKSVVFHCRSSPKRLLNACRGCHLEHRHTKAKALDAKREKKMLKGHCRVWKCGWKAESWVLILMGTKGYKA